MTNFVLTWNDFDSHTHVIHVWKFLETCIYTNKGCYYDENLRDDYCEVNSSCLCSSIVNEEVFRVWGSICGSLALFDLMKCFYSNWIDLLFVVSENGKLLWVPMEPVMSTSNGADQDRLRLKNGARCGRLCGHRSGPRLCGSARASGSATSWHRREKWHRSSLRSSWNHDRTRSI